MSKPPEPKLETIPQDARYHNCNATNWCFATFVDFQKCIRLLGDGHQCCGEFKKIYQTVCPNQWVKRWEDQIEIGTFPVELPPRKNDCSNIK